MVNLLNIFYAISRVPLSEHPNERRWRRSSKMQQTVLRLRSRERLRASSPVVGGLLRDRTPRRAPPPQYATDGNLNSVIKLVYQYFE